MKTDLDTSHLIVLHLCLWSHWFAATEDQNNTAAQKEAIRTAEVIFKYIAQTYLKMPTPNTAAAVPRPVMKPVIKAPSFLTSACSFQWLTIAATTMPILKCTPWEELSEELTQYFNFKAAPIKRQGDEGSISDEPSAKEVLLNLLLWWKVSTLAIWQCPSDSNIWYSGTCFWIPHHHSDGLGLSCHPCNQCLCWTSLLEVTAPL